MLELEVEVLTMMNHPNIVKLHRVYDTKTKMYMVLELVTGGELLEKLMSDGAYSEHDCCDLFVKVISAVKVRLPPSRSCRSCRRACLLPFTPAHPPPPPLHLLPLRRVPRCSPAACHAACRRCSARACPHWVCCGREAL